MMIDLPRPGEQLRAGHLHRGRRAGLVHDRLQVPGRPGGQRSWASCATIPTGGDGTCCEPRRYLPTGHTPARPIRPTVRSGWASGITPAGLMRFNPATSQWTSYRDSLKTKVVGALYFDQDNNLVFPEYTWGLGIRSTERQVLSLLRRRRGSLLQEPVHHRGRARARRDLYAGQLLRLVRRGVHRRGGEAGRGRGLRRQDRRPVRGLDAEQAGRRGSRPTPSRSTPTASTGWAAAAGSGPTIPGAAIGTAPTSGWARSGTSRWIRTAGSGWPATRGSTSSRATRSEWEDFSGDRGLQQRQQLS